MKVDNRLHKCTCSYISGYWMSLFHFPACSPGMYKAGLGNTQCQNCPANSTVVGAVTCNCTRGHYRMNGEGAADPCTSKLIGVLFHFTTQSQASLRTLSAWHFMMDTCIKIWFLVSSWCSLMLNRSASQRASLTHSWLCWVSSIKFL